MKEIIKKLTEDSIKIKQALLNDEYISLIEKTAKLMIDALKKDNKIFICGNGGSAAQASHFAAELMGRFEKERKALPAIALTTDQSIITAWTNDYNFETLFERQVEALGNSGDILIGLSTSGNSENVIKAFKKAKELDMINIALTGKEGGKMKDIQEIDYNIIIPSNNTARIQEAHLLIIHIWCKLIEDGIFH